MNAVRHRSHQPPQQTNVIRIGENINSGHSVVLQPSDLRAHMLVSGRTGGGKSRFLMLLLAAYIRGRQPFFLLDPTGVLFRAAREMVATQVIESSQQHSGQRPNLLLRRHLFLDLEDEDNPLRINPLEANPETTEEQAGDVLSALERLVHGDFTSQARRLLNLLGNTLVILAELNRLPADQRPSFPGAGYPLNLYDVPTFLTGDNAWRARLLHAIPERPSTRFAKQFFLGQFQSYSATQRAERVESTLNLLSPMLSSSVVSCLFNTRQSTLHLPSMLRQGVSLMVHVPLGRSFQAAQVVGTYLPTVLQRAAYRRPLGERQQTYVGMVDEFQNFATHEFATGFATLRQYGLFWIVAHQDESQAPFHTVEGRNMLESIRANTRIKVLFSQNRVDAETLSKSIARLSQEESFGYEEEAQTVGQSTTQTSSRSTTRSRVSSVAHRQGLSRSLSRTEGFSLSRTRGTTIGETLTEGLSSSVANGLAQAVSMSETNGVTVAESEEHGLTLTLGENFSHVVDHSTGVSFTEREGESLAFQEGVSQTKTHGEQYGRTHTTGTSIGRTVSQQQTHSSAHESSTGETHGQQQTESANSSTSNAERAEFGTSLVRSTRGFGLYEKDPSSLSEREGLSETRQEGEGSSVAHTQTASSSQSWSRSQSLASSHGMSVSETEEYSQALSLARNVAEAHGLSRSETVSRDHGRSFGRAEGYGEHVGDGWSSSIGESYGSGSSESFSQQHGRSASVTSNCTLTHGQRLDLARAFSVIASFTQGLSRSLQQMVGVTEDVTRTQQQGLSTGWSTAHAQGDSLSVARSKRRRFFGLEGEREQVINELQALAVQHCVVSKASLQAVVVRVVDVPEVWWEYARGDLPHQLMALQRKRIQQQGDAHVVLDRARRGAVRSFRKVRRRGRGEKQRRVLRKR